MNKFLKKKISETNLKLSVCAHTLNLDKIEFNGKYFFKTGKGVMLDV